MFRWPGKGLYRNDEDPRDATPPVDGGVRFNSSLGRAPADAWRGVNQNGDEQARLRTWNTLTMLRTSLDQNVARA